MSGDCVSYNFKAKVDDSFKKDVKLLKNMLKVESNQELLEKLIKNKKNEIFGEYRKLSTAF